MLPDEVEDRRDSKRRHIINEIVRCCRLIREEEDLIDSIEAEKQELIEQYIREGFDRSELDQRLEEFRRSQEGEEAFGERPPN